MPSAVYCSGIRADCDHRIANLSGSGLHVFRDGRSWHQLPPSAFRGHPVHPAGGSGDVLPGHYAVQLKLSDDPIYRKRLEEGLVELRGEKQIEIKSGAKTSVWLFLLGVVGVVIYAIINSPSMGLVEKPLMNTTNAILIIMLSVATLTTVICKVDTDNILNSSTFKAGMSACICILGVAWLGDTFVSNNIDWIKDTAGEVIQGHPWLLAVIFFFASALLYSQAATAKALMPMALALNVSPLTAVASFAAVSGLFILPTYPTLVAAVQMDDTGTTRIGKFVFNHPFFIPGTLGVALAVCFGFVLGSFML